MPIINIVPKDELTEKLILEIIEKLRETIKNITCEISGFPKTDILVNLMRCPYRNSDPDSADAIVYIETNPNEDFEDEANYFCKEIAQIFIDCGFTSRNGIEIWTRFVPGPWCLVKKGAIEEFVTHA